MTHSGGKPHTNVGDRGQRYEVTFEDPVLNLRRVLGWSDTVAGAEQMVRGIKAHPSWCNPEVVDRHEPPNV